jgi:hypothetical protein
MSYTPHAPDVKEYLKQIARHRDAMIGAITSDQGVRVPQEILDLVVARVEDAYKTIDFWIRFRSSPGGARATSRLPAPRD